MCESSVKFRWTLISLREIGLLINHTRIFMKKISHIDIYIFTHILKLAHTLSACTIWVHQNLDSMKKKTDPVIIAPNSKIAYILKNANVFRVFFTLQLNRSACFIVWKFNRIKYSMKLWYVPAKKWFFLCFSFFLSFFFSSVFMILFIQLGIAFGNRPLSLHMVSYVLRVLQYFSYVALLLST